MVISPSSVMSLTSRAGDEVVIRACRIAMTSVEPRVSTMYMVCARLSVGDATAASHCVPR